jgi:TatA/E family protein of Tat protein translocase
VFGIGMGEMVIILAVALLVFGPQKLPEIAKGLAKGLRDLKRAGDDLRASIELDDEVAHRRPMGRPAERTAPLPDPAHNEPPAQIPGSELTGSAPPTNTPAPPPATAAAPPRWPQPADGTQAQGSLEGVTAHEAPPGTGAEPPDAPPSEVKGT